MASAQDIEDAVKILLGGRIVKGAVDTARTVRAEQAAFRALERRSQAELLGRGAMKVGKFGVRQGVTKNPLGVAALLAYEGYIHRDEIAEVSQRLLEGAGGPVVPERLMATGGKRKVSKANKAVKHAMSLLKAGTKASTGADKGKLPRGAFKTAVKAAGLANPRTPSRIKGKGRIKNLARKLKRWW